LPEKGHAFLRPLKKKGFKEENMTRMRLDNLSTSTTLESNKSLSRYTLFINGIATPPMAKYSGVHSRSYCVII
jgi:hypothetical protein